MSEGRSPGRRPRVSDEEVLAVFETTGDPVLTTAEVASRLPIGKRATLDRLRALESAGDLHSKTVGARGVVWWRQTDNEERLADDPFITAPTYASGRSNVSEDIDAALAETYADEGNE